MTSLIPWKSFNDIDRFFGDDDFFFPAVTRQAVPAIDISEDDNTVTAEAELPAINPENVEVTVANNVLTISGHTEEKKEEKKKGYVQREIRKGSFSRSIRLPAPVEDEAADATYKDGILKIVMKKTQEARPKKIDIKRG